VAGVCLTGTRACAQEHGTAFALLRTRDAIYVAADSKLSWVDTTGAPGSTCKIRRAGGTWYVMGGIYQYTPLGYNAPALARLSLGGTRPVMEKARDFETRATPQVEKLLSSIEDMRDQDVDWQEVITIPLTVFLFGFENGGPAVSSREFTRVSREGAEPTVSIRRRDYDAGMPETVWLASPSSLAGGFVSEYPSWQAMEPAAMVKAFVEFASRKRPGTTGGPVDILRVDRNGHKWLRKKTDCTD
jgi:hypothetical protein